MSANDKTASARYVRGFASALAGAALWGLSGSCAQQALSAYDASPLFITAIRTAIAAALLLAFCFCRHKQALSEIVGCAPLRASLLLFGTGLFLSQWTFALSVKYTNAGTATVIQSLATVFVMIIACATGRRLPRMGEALGLACAMASTWLIATQGDPATMVLPANGLFWGLVNALSVTLYLMIPKKLYRRWASIPVISCGMAIAAIVAAVFWLGEAAVQGGFSIPSLDAAGLFVLVGGIAVLGTACAFGLYLHGVAVVGSVKGSLLGAAEPVSAMVITAFWLQTAFSGADWAGLVLMVAMVFLVSIPGRDAQDCAGQRSA